MSEGRAVRPGARSFNAEARRTRRLAKGEEKGEGETGGQAAKRASSATRREGRAALRRVSPRV